MCSVSWYTDYKINHKIMFFLECCLMLFLKRRFLTFYDQWYQHQNNNDSSHRASHCSSLCWAQAVCFFPKEQTNPLSLVHFTYSYHFRADRKPFWLSPPSPYKTAVITEPMWLRPVKFYHKVPGDTLSAAPFWTTWPQSIRERAWK